MIACGINIVILACNNSHRNFLYSQEFGRITLAPLETFSLVVSVLPRHLKSYHLPPKLTTPFTGPARCWIQSSLAADVHRRNPPVSWAPKCIMSLFCREGMLLYYTLMWPYCYCTPKSLFNSALSLLPWHEKQEKNNCHVVSRCGSHTHNRRHAPPHFLAPPITQICLLKILWETLVVIYVW